MKEMRILLTSDIHNCHHAWFAGSNAERMADYIACMKEAKAKNRYDACFILGDVSLDFWVCNEGGSYLQDIKVSNTKIFWDTIQPHLPKPTYICAGNHEQYSDEDFAKITGQHRQQIVALSDEVVFVLLDAFSGNLDPKEHSDGTYQPIDCTLIKKALADYPNAMIFLGAHYFDMPRESDEFKTLLKENDRIKALCMGHDHMTYLQKSGADSGDKIVLRSGNFSYSGEKDWLRAFRGWREILIHEDGSFESFYYVPAQTFRHQGFTVTISENTQDHYRSIK